MTRLASLGLLLSSLSIGSLATSFDLSQLHWTLKNQNGSIVIPASGPPTHVHLDLVKAGIITEPLLGINDYTQRWVSNDNWTYTADLGPFQQKFSSHESLSTLLVFYGIDTVANIVSTRAPDSHVEYMEIST